MKENTRDKSKVTRIYKVKPCDAKITSLLADEVMTSTSYVLYSAKDNLGQTLCSSFLRICEFSVGF